MRFCQAPKRAPKKKNPSAETAKTEAELPCYILGSIICQLAPNQFSLAPCNLTTTYHVQ